MENLQTQSESLNEIFLQDDLTNYNVYEMSMINKILYILLAGAILFGIGYIFYQDYIISGFLSLLAVKYPEMKTKSIIKKRKDKLLIQFRDLLHSLSSAVAAGKSLENAFKEALIDLKILYPEDDTDIIVELRLISVALELNQPVSAIFQNFAERTGLDDIKDFANVLRLIDGKSSDVITVIMSSAKVINEKMEVKEEIETLLTSKKFEAKAMSLAPIALMGMLSYTSPDYMSPIFTTFAGRISVTIAVLIFVISYFLTNKIMNINL